MPSRSASARKADPRDLLATYESRWVRPKLAAESLMRF